MNNDQNNGALKFSLVGLLACGAIAAYFMSPAVHQAVAASLSYVLLMIALGGYIITVYQSKQHEEASRWRILGTLLLDGGLAYAAVAACITIATNPSFAQFQIIDGAWDFTGSSMFSRLERDTLFGMLAVAAWSRALVPGKIFGGETDNLFPLRWFALGAAAVPAVIHLHANLPHGFWAIAPVTAVCAGLLFAMIPVLWSGMKNPVRDTADQHLRGSRLLTASALADAIGSRLKK